MKEKPLNFRSMSLLYEDMTEIRGIKLRRYVPPDESSLSGYTDNNGFCVPPNCPPAGLLNISCCLPSSKNFWIPIFDPLLVWKFKIYYIRKYLRAPNNK